MIGSKAIFDRGEPFCYVECRLVNVDGERTLAFSTHFAANSYEAEITLNELLLNKELVDIHNPDKNVYLPLGVFLMDFLLHAEERIRQHDNSLEEKA